MSRRILLALTCLWLLPPLPVLGLPAVAHPASEPLAEVDGVTITAEEVEQALGAPLAKLQEQIYTMKRQKLEALIAERLLAHAATKRGVSVQTLLDNEVTPKVALVTAQEIEAFYQANKARLKGEEAALREQIRAHLQKQKLAAQRQAFVQTLQAQAQVVMHLQAPPVFRAQVSTDGAPFKGAAQAPITIVKFEDFRCPFCKRVQATLNEILSRYGEQVKLVHRGFPLDRRHPAARKVYEATQCANDQGKFWAYHDLIYSNAPQASPEHLTAFAQGAGLDLTAFEQCLATGKYQAAVQQDIDEGTRLGVTGTPAFFVNGRLLSGAQPLANFTRVIEEELARAQ